MRMEEVSLIWFRMCSDCFDYDLCSACYATKARAHFHGAHEFSKVWG